MITIRSRIYNSENSSDITFTRLGLDVESVDEPIVSTFGDTTLDTQKQWVGTIEKTTGTFEIVQPNAYVLPLRILEGNFYTIHILGKVFDEGLTCKIELDFALGSMAFLRIVLISLLPILAITGFILEDQWEEIKTITPFLLVFTIPGTLLLILQLNAIEKKIMNSLGIK